MSGGRSPLAGRNVPAALLLDVPALLAAYDELRPDPTVAEQRVAFGTSGHRGVAFERSFNVTYPSFKDVTGKVLLSLSKYVPAQAVPTTVILDEKGRVASRVLGQANPSILKTLVETVTKGA